MSTHRLLIALVMVGLVVAAAPGALAGPGHAARLIPLHHHHHPPAEPTERRHHPTVLLEAQTNGFQFVNGKLVRPVNRLAAPPSLIGGPNPHDLRAKTPMPIDRKGRTPITIRNSGD